MNCFNHRDTTAVGVCKACGKALCSDCLAEVEGGLACKDNCESKVAAGPSYVGYRGVRKRSSLEILGFPLYDIAMGPDFQKGEMRGHARGIIAIGDTARGGLAIGGLACGVIAFGGLALGVIAIGGLAVGGLALGGGAIGGIAIGGGAVGYYAVGGGAVGKYVISGAERSPEAVEFLKRWAPWLPELKR